MIPQISEMISPIWFILITAAYQSIGVIKSNNRCNQKENNQCNQKEIGVIRKNGY